MPAIVAAPSQAVPQVGRDPAVITEWNAIASRTISTENATPVPASPLFFAFTSIAMHDAVAAIEGDFEPYLEQPRAHAHASPDVAAATAAHRVLRHYFPASAENLDADYAAFLADVPNGVGKVHGTRVGLAAADALIALRADDDFTTVHPIEVEPGIGVWEPTPPGFAPMAVSWLGFVTPFVLDSPTSIPLPGPDPVDSAEYAVDYEEVKAKGALTGSTRTDDETATALFWMHARRPGRAVQRGDADRDRRAWPGHQPDRPCVRAARHVDFGCQHLLLVREVELRLLAPGDRDTRGGRRQPRDADGCHVDAPGRHSAVPRLHERPCLRERLRLRGLRLPVRRRHDRHRRPLDRAGQT